MVAAGLLWAWEEWFSPRQQMPRRSFLSDRTKFRGGYTQLILYLGKMDTISISHKASLRHHFSLWIFVTTVPSKHDITKVYSLSTSRAWGLLTVLVQLALLNLKIIWRPVDSDYYFFLFFFLAHDSMNRSFIPRRKIGAVADVDSIAPSFQSWKWWAYPLQHDANTSTHFWPKIIGFTRGENHSWHVFIGCISQSGIREWYTIKPQQLNPASIQFCSLILGQSIECTSFQSHSQWRFNRRDVSTIMVRVSLFSFKDGCDCNSLWTRLLIMARLESSNAL